MGKLATVAHEGSEITLSMIKWGALRRMLNSRSTIFGAVAPTPFIPQYEIAIYDGSSKAIFSKKPIFIFFYPDKETALEKWDELVEIIEQGGLYGKTEEFIRDGDPRKQGVYIFSQASKNGASRQSKLKKLLKELRAEIAAETLKFSSDVKSKYDEQPSEIKTEPGELNQMLLNLGALSFFVHALDRLSFRPQSESLRKIIHTDTALELSHLYGKMIGAISVKLAPTAEEFVLNHLDIRGSQFAKAPSLFGDSAHDRTGAVWLAASAISEDVDHPNDLILAMLIKNRLMQGFINLSLPDRVEAIEELVGIASVPTAQVPGASSAAEAPQSFEDGTAAYQRGDHATAMRLWRPIADQGHAEAQFNLGAIYSQGQGVPQDDAAATNWYRKAADQGHARAQYNLGVRYDNGLGVPQEYAEAMKWFRKAADQGHAAAQFNLGIMYDNGRGVPQDYAEVASWFRLAADQGNAIAQCNLGSMYADGQGVPQNYVKAHMWFNLAAAQGNQDAVKSRDLVEQRMAPAQIIEAQKLAAMQKMDAGTMTDEEAARLLMGSGTPTKAITPEDEENYGNELIDLAKRAARDAMDPELNTLLHEILSQLNAMQTTNTGSFSAALLSRLLMGGETTNKLITPEDEVAFGSELVDLAKRAARDAMDPELNTLRQELLSQIATMGANSTRDTPSPQPPTKRSRQRTKRTKELS